jgi:hypothetical protein
MPEKLSKQVPRKPSRLQRFDAFSAQADKEAEFINLGTCLGAQNSRNFKRRNL